MKIGQVLIAISQLGNTLLGGYADESISSRSYRQSASSRRWRAARRLVDFVVQIMFLQVDHCQDAHIRENSRIAERANRK